MRDSRASTWPPGARRNPSAVTSNARSWSPSARSRCDRPSRPASTLSSAELWCRAPLVRALHASRASRPRSSSPAGAVPTRSSRRRQPCTARFRGSSSASRTNPTQAASRFAKPVCGSSSDTGTFGGTDHVVRDWRCQGCQTSRAARPATTTVPVARIRVLGRVSRSRRERRGGGAPRDVTPGAYPNPTISHPNGGCRHPPPRLESRAVSMVVAAGRRHLPRGWADLGRQLAIWFGFAVLYQLARGIADRKPPEVALAHGRAVVDLETRVTHRLYELTLQNFVDQRHLLETAVSWTYWNSEFTVVGLRNSILLANLIGLVGYVVMPTAPPRLLGLGFADSHRDGLVSLAANPYAAMPSLHAADALIVGVVLCSVTRRWWVKAIWIAWPAWVWFAVMATGNHFWLDCMAGIGVALISMGVVYNDRIRAAFAARRA